jgi:hypothetical protein
MNMVSKINNHIERNSVQEIKQMRNLKNQQPADGIMKVHDWGNTKTYKVACSCGDDNHSHNMWVESDSLGVTVTINTQLKSKWISYKTSKLNLIWTLLTKGYIEMEESIILSRQQAHNYANTLLRATNDVQEFANANR